MAIPRTATSACSLWFIAMLILAAPTSAEQLPMDVSVVDTGFIYYYDLGIDPDGSAHAYIDNTEFDQLYYNSNVGGAWGTPQFIHHTSDWGSINVSGAVDTGGFSHIAFDGGRAGRPNDNFFYATNRSGSWVCTQVMPNMRWYALDLGPSPLELPRVSYYDNYSGLNYATMMPDQSWTHANVDNSGGVTTYAGRYSDLVVDDSDYGHISYYYYVDKDIRYATNSGGSWEWEVVDSDPNIASKSWITLAPDGSPIVNYRISGRIWIARRVSGLWVSTPVTAPGNFGQSDVKADAAGHAIVAYNDLGSDNLMLAIQNESGFDHYDIHDVPAGGDGPILQILGTEVHVLAWDQGAAQLLYLRGQLPGGSALDPTPAAQRGAAIGALQLRVLPNPLRRGGAFHLVLPAAGTVQIAVHDAAGREVWHWQRSRVAAGALVVPWSASDKAGRALSRGTYFCNVQVGAAAEGCRLLVVR